MNEAWYSTNDLAERLKISDQTVRLWVRQGKVKARKFGRAWRIPGSEIERVIAEGIREDGAEERTQ